MRDIRLLVRDADENWSGTIRRGEFDVAIAALSADPLTMAELKDAVARFARGDAMSWLGDLRPQASEDVLSADSAVIDLVARLVVAAPTCSVPGPHGTIRYRDERGETEVAVTYHLAEDWLLLAPRAEWRAAADARRRRRAQNPPLDARAVLYGRPLAEFVAHEMRKAFELGALNADDADRTYETLKNVHAAWLLTPRRDLRGACPRDAILERRDHLMRDLQDRSDQWSRREEPPPGLAESSFAFRYGGFGTHEAVLYYGLVRELLWSSSDRLQELSDERRRSGRSEASSAREFLTSEANRLEMVRDEWLDSPDPELHLRTPRSILLRERRRLPEAVSGEEAMIDPDCPCCRMLRDLPGPVFWHLDGSEMDDDFAFDIYCRTREDREEQRREWEQRRNRRDVEQDETDDLFGDSNLDSPWTTSFSAAGTDAPFDVRVVGIGCRLAELIADLRGDRASDTTSEFDRQSIDRLNQDFGSLHELSPLYPSTAASLLEPVVDRFVESLSDVGAARVDLASRCEALAHEAKDLLTELRPMSDES